MDPQQKELRQAAAKAFMQSLEQLGETLQGTANSDSEPYTTEGPLVPDDCVHAALPLEALPPTDLPDTEAVTEDEANLESFEQAVADIDRFIQAQQPRSQTQPDRLPAPPPPHPSHPQPRNR